MKLFLNILILLAASLIFTIGLFIRPRNETAKNFFLVTGAVIGFIFYLKTFLQVIRSHSLSQQRKIFWMVVIICVPIAGNLLYLIIQDTLSTKQIPHGEW